MNLPAEFNPWDVLNHWLHLISAVIWIGGAAYQVFVLAPQLKAGDVPLSTLLASAKRFRKISLVALITLVTTGGINIGIRRAGHEFIPPGYVSALGVKIFLVVIISSGLVFGFVRASQLEEESRQNLEAGAVLPFFSFTKMTLLIGVIVVFIAAMLRQWKF